MIRMINKSNWFEFFGKEAVLFQWLCNITLGVVLATPILFLIFNIIFIITETEWQTIDSKKRRDIKTQIFHNTAALVFMSGLTVGFFFLLNLIRGPEIININRQESLANKILALFVFASIASYIYWTLLWIPLYFWANTSDKIAMREKMEKSTLSSIVGIIILIFGILWNIFP